MTRRALLAAGGLVAVAALAGCTRVIVPELRMAAGEPGGTYVRFGELLRQEVKRARIASEMDVVRTAGSLENLRQLLRGQVDVAISLADSVEQPSVELRALGRVYQNYLQCVVRADAGIRAIDDLRGHDVSIGATGSGTSRTALRVLSVRGLSMGTTPMRAHELGLSDAVTALGTGEISALFWSGGVPLPELARLDGVVEYTAIDLSDALPALLREHPGSYVPTLIPRGVYGLTEDLPAIGVSNLLLVRASMPDQLAQALVDVLLDRAAELVPEPSVGIQFLTPSNLIATGPVQLHAAAAARYAQRYG